KRNGGGEPSPVRFFDTRAYDDDATEFSYGIPQLLRLMNSRLTNSSAEVAARLVRANNGDMGRVITEMYLMALSRRPAAAELSKMSAYGARQGDPVRGCAGVFWA